MKTVSTYGVLSLILSALAIMLAGAVVVPYVTSLFDRIDRYDYAVLLSYLAVLVSIIAAVKFFIGWRDRALAQKDLENRDVAIGLREEALDEHTIVSVIDRDGSIISVNENWLETFGYSRDEVIGQKTSLLYDDADKADFASVRATVSGGETWRGQQVLRTKEGRRVAVQTTILPCFDERGQHTSSISIRTDLTRALVDGAQSGQRALVEAFPDEIYIYDRENYILSYVNDRGRKRIRKSLDDVVGRCLLDFFKDDELLLFRQHMRAVMTSATKTARIEMDHKFGPVEILTHCYEDEAGDSQLVSVLRDTSQRKKDEKLKISSVSTVSHELRTPLTSIKGALRLLASGVVGELSPDVSKLVTVAHRNSDRLLAIVNDILILEKLLSKEVPISVKKVDLRDLLQECIEANAPFALECDVALELELPETPAYVDADPDRLMQVATNLVSNAAKFSPAGSIVLLRIDDEVETWRVCVQDQGPGIPESARATIFDSFTQIAETKSDSHPSTGLGLAICKEIIRSHNGFIGFETVVGEGTTFYFDLLKADVNVAEGSISAVA